jgi:hypothetical protein
MQARFLFREASQHEFSEIRQFYLRNPDDHVMFRAEPDVRKAIADGVFFLALDVTRSEGDRIVGASAVYTIAAPDSSGPKRLLMESGGSRVADEYKGFGLHKLFHAARALHKFINDRKGFDRYFAAIICPNDPSVRNCGTMGFTPWEDPPVSLVTAREQFAKAGQQVRYFQLSQPALVKHAQRLLECDVVGSLTNDRTGAICKLEMAIQLLRLNRLTVQLIANGDLEKGLEAPGWLDAS